MSLPDPLQSANQAAEGPAAERQHSAGRAFDLARDAAEHEGSRRGPLPFWAWLPVPLLLTAIVALKIQGSSDPHESVLLGIVSNLIFSTVASLLVVYLVARGFLVSGSIGLLLLGCGAIAWSAAGVLALVAGGSDINLQVTIHNSCVGFSACCHLAGVLLSMRPRRAVRFPGLALPVAFAVVLGAMSVIVLVGRDHGLPTFFVPGEGGTLLRQLVLGSSLGMFAVAAVALIFRRSSRGSTFDQWYGLALALVAIGLFGVLIERNVASALGWVGRGAQLLSGVYMIFAAVAALRESTVLAVSLEASLRESEERFRTLVELAPDAVLVHQDRKIVFANAASVRLYAAQSPEQILGKDIVELVHPDDRESATGRIGIAQGGARTPLREFRLLTLDGREISAEASGAGVHYRGRPAVQVIIRDITERKRAEEALRLSEQRFRMLHESLRDPFVQVDMEGRIIDCNDLYSQMLGYSPAEIRSLSYQQVTPERWHAFEDRIVRDQIIARGYSDVYQKEYRRKDGTVFPVELRTIMSHDAAGRPNAMWGIVRDITERKRAEEELRRSREEYRHLVEASGSVILRVDKEMRITFVNQHGLRFFGYVPDEILGRRALGTIVPAADEAGRDTASMAEDILRHPDRYQTNVHQNMRKDGSLVWMAWANQPICDENGNLVEILAIGNDLTQLKRAEEALRESEARYRELVRLAPAGIYEVNFRTGRFTSVNDAMIEILGYSREELLSMSPFDILDGESRAGFKDRLARWLSGEKPEAEVEYRIRTKDGRTIEALLAVSFTVDQTGRPLGATVVAHDITERKRAEEALQGSREALREANSRLTEADRRKNEFLAVLSHELRNPLAPVANSLYILDHAPPGGDQANRAKEVIGRQVAQLSHLVNDLLDVTRITRGKVQLQKERLELNEVVRRAVEDNRSSFDRLGVILDLVPAPRPVPVIADGARIVQVVGNLLQNAAKFTSKGGHARVLVAIEAGDAVVRVVDNGVGIAQGTLERLFEPFMQAEQTLDRSKGGLGLGLALVKGLVELHGGTVAAHSEGLGQGTEMVVRLPLDTGAALEVAATQAPMVRTHRRILIIEDNADAADSLSEALEFGDHEVAVAYNGPEGIAKAREFLPDVVLCDIGLPGMDGYEVARAFRADEALRGTFLVALSGYALPEDLQRAAEAGFERHLAKPPSLEKLEEVLASVPPQPPSAESPCGRGTSP